MSRRDVRDAIHVARPDGPPVGKSTYLDGVNVSKTKKLSAKPVDFHYDTNGKLTDETNKSFAKYTESFDGSKVYFIKFATSGSFKGQMLNTNGIYYKVGDETRFDRALGRNIYEFQKVGENVFNLYLKFLQSKNEKYILQAEREVVNGPTQG